MIIMKGMTPLDKTDFDITNVYRTENFIVYQSVHVCYGDNGNVLISDDIYWSRTPERDSWYETLFGDEKMYTKRKRMKVAAYTRTYKN